MRCGQRMVARLFFYLKRMKKQLIFALIALLFSSCTAFKYGSSSNVTIQSTVGNDENVEIAVSGERFDMAYHDVKLPFTMKVKHKNLPLEVSVVSPKNLYKDFTVNSKRVGLDMASVVGWTFLGASLAYLPVCILDSSDGMIAYEAVFGGLGIAGILCGGKDIPEKNDYVISPLKQASSKYEDALLARPLIRINAANEREIVQNGLVRSYSKNDDGKVVCRLSTVDGITVIDYDKGYSNIKKVSKGGYDFYLVEKIKKGKPYYGACDMLGREIVAPKYKKKLKIFGRRVGYKEKKPIENLDFYVCSQGKYDKTSRELNETALSMINDGYSDESVLQKLKWSIYIDANDVNPAYYLLGHYYCFGSFGEKALEKGGGLINRAGLAPIDSVKGLEYLNRSFSSEAASVFADKSAWTYNPVKAVRMYCNFSGFLGDINKESEKIKDVFLNDENFYFDVEYYYNQAMIDFSKNKDMEEVADFMLWFPHKVDTIVSLIDKIPVHHKSYELNLANLDNGRLLYMGIDRFNKKQFASALYYFRRGAMHGDGNCYTMSVMCLDSLARKKYPKVSNYEVAVAFCDFFPYKDKKGLFAQKEQEFVDYYNNVCDVIEKEEERARLERQREEQRRRQVRREQNRAILGTILQGFVQGFQAYTNVRQAPSYSRGRSSYSRGGSALDIQLPEAFNPQRVAMMSQPVYSYDEYGNLMVSFPGFAQSLGEMNSEIQKVTQQTANKLMATGDSYYIAKAQSLQAVANTHQWTTAIDQQTWSTPMYPSAWAELAENEESYDVDFDEDLSSEDETSIIEDETDGNSMSTNRKSLSVSDDNKRQKNDGKKTWNASRNEDETNELDAKLQFHQGKVASSDYEVVKKNVTLYLRDGDNAKVFMRNKDLCRKGASYYIDVNGKYYLVRYSNWSRFDSAIGYAGTSVYFDK